MHTLVVLDPGHFHAALALREPHPLVRDEVFVYAPGGPELDQFLALVAAFNARPERPTRWRPVVRTGAEPLERLLAERAGDVVLLAGKNDRKMGWIRRLHDAGFHVLADKPWLVSPGALPDLRHTLAGPPLALEMMTGRHEVTATLEVMLVGEADVLGELSSHEAGAAIEMESVHHLDKRVNGAPLRRPPWFFDVAVQGDGLADIPTHLVDHAQRLVGGARRVGEAAARPPRDAGPGLELVSARCWPTLVPRDVFARVTGMPDFPGALADRVVTGRLALEGNAELVFRCAGVPVRAGTRWDLSPPPGGGDTHRSAVRGTRAEIRVEQGAHTGWTRRLRVEPRPGATGVETALDRCVAAWQGTFPGLGMVRADRGWEIRVPDALRTGHEAHFPLVLAELLRYLEGGTWPARRQAEALAKYELLARAQTTATRSRPAPAR